MANNLVTPTKVIKEVARELLNNLKFAAKVNRSYDDQYKSDGSKVGDTVKARLPQRFRVYKGAALQIQPISDKTVDIKITDQAQTGIEFSMRSLTLEVEDYKKRYIMPAVHALVNQVDFDGLSRMYKKVAKFAGVPGTTPGSTGTLPRDANFPYLNAGTKLSEVAVPDPRIAMLSPDMHAQLAAANMTLFNPTADVSRFFREGQFGGQALGVSEWYETQNIPIHTTGQMGGTPVVASAPSEGATSVSVSGFTAAAANRLKDGDIVTFASVYEINPMNYASVGRLKEFVVVGDCDSASDGTATLYFQPPMYASGNGANCSALPAANAAILQFGHVSSYASKTSPQGLIYHEDAFALVMADLEMPGGVWVAERISNKELGVAIRFLKAYNIDTDQSPARLDTLYGWSAIRQELACRVCAGPGA